MQGDAERIAARRRTLEAALADRQGAIERMLAARRAGGAPDSLRVALSGEDPASIGRRLRYAGYVSRAAAALLAGYRAAIAEAAQLAREAQSRRDRLRAIAEAARAQRDTVLAERRERRRVFERVASEIRAARKQIKVLRADEARLSRLVENLGRVIYGRVEKVPEPGGGPGRFSALRGSLRLPVAGELIGRFGAPRGATGLEAKGVFIRAPQGQPVRAVAAGQVVYSDWMRGFGNLLIVDHGDAYLSIYANNDSVLKRVGDAVAKGETIATTGASGGNEESGLYFELRHLGKAFDPLRWVKLR